MARGGDEAKSLCKGMGAYAVLRELYLVVEDEGVREGVERCVQLLMGDEVNEDARPQMMEEKSETRVVEVGEEEMRGKEDGEKSGGGGGKMVTEREGSDSEDEKMVTTGKK
ncbi:MAG: hypothetical protein Q9201_006473 [Fulgogasparrea decipioides]